MRLTNDYVLNVTLIRECENVKNTWTCLCVRAWGSDLSHAVSDWLWQGSAGVSVRCLWRWLLISVSGWSPAAAVLIYKAQSPTVAWKHLQGICFSDFTAATGDMEARCAGLHTHRVIIVLRMWHLLQRQRTRVYTVLFKTEMQDHDRSKIKLKERVSKKEYSLSYTHIYTPNFIPCWISLQ